MLLLKSGIYFNIVVTNSDINKLTGDNSNYYLVILMDNFAEINRAFPMIYTDHMSKGLIFQHNLDNDPQ